MAPRTRIEGSGAANAAPPSGACVEALPPFAGDRDLAGEQPAPAPEGTPIANARLPTQFPTLEIREGRAVADLGKSLFVPGVDGKGSFAAYLPEDSIPPEFGKRDLVAFSLARDVADGDACLVDTGQGEVGFRRALALPGGTWRLQAADRKVEPIHVTSGRRARIWPAIRRWQTLIRRSRR